MKLDRHDLRQMIKEAMGNLSEADWDRRKENWDWFKKQMQREPAAYFAWVESGGHGTPDDSSVLVSYIIDELGSSHPSGLPDIRNERKVIGKLADAVDINRYDVLADVVQQVGKRLAHTPPAGGIDEDGIEEIIPLPSP